MSRWIEKMLVATFFVTGLSIGVGQAQDLRIVRTVGPYSHGVAVENLHMVQPGSLALSLAVNRGSGILDTIDPPTGRRISVIDTQLNVDMALAWQQTEHLRLHLAVSGAHIDGNPFGDFDGGGYELGDTDVGVRWRVFNQPNTGLELGLYADLIFPTGDGTQLAGAGSTNLQVGTLLSQRFDDLSFQGMLGYRHRFKSASFADARFRHVVDYRAGLYVPLDWPHWVVFTEVAGILNTTSSDTDGTEPAEAFGGVTFGEFTNVAIAFSAGLNAQGGAPARRFSMRVSHHFGAQEREMTAEVMPAATEVAHFNTERGRLSKQPTLPKEKSTNGGTSVEKRTSNRTKIEGVLQKQLIQVTSNEDKKGSKTPGRKITPKRLNTLKPVRGLRAPSTPKQGGPADALRSQKRNAHKIASTKTVRTLVASPREITKPQQTTVPEIRPAPSKRPGSSLSVPIHRSNVTAASERKTPKVSAKKKATKSTPNANPVSKPKPIRSVTSATRTIPDETSGFAIKRPGPNVKPMVTPRAALSLPYDAGQKAPSNAALKTLVGEVQAHLKTTPSTVQILVEGYAAPGERPYTPRTHTAQRDAYQLAQARSDHVITKLRQAFPKIRFKSAPRIWPSHVVKGNDFWSGIVLTPSEAPTTKTNHIKNVQAEKTDRLTLNLTLASAVDSNTVDVLTDGLDVVIVRIRPLDEVRKWVRVRHPAVKRALIHPSYETANAGILRVRLNGFLPTNYRESLKVTVQNNVIRVVLPTLNKNKK